jgi:predicted permease
MRNDLRLAARLLLKDRAFTAAAVLVLALGIASTSTVFTLVNGLLLRDMPFDEPDRVVELGEVSYRDLQDWRSAVRTLDAIEGVAERAMSISDDAGLAERVDGAYISANAFRLLGQRPALGRDFHADDDRDGALPVVILGHDVWRTRYQADPAVIGRSIRVNAVASTVIGVMPPGFRFREKAGLWQPLAMLPAPMRNARDEAQIDGFGRLRAGATVAQARTELGTIAASLARQFPDDSREVQPPVARYRMGLGADTLISVVFLLMLGAVGCVLLIACGNVANLLLARAAVRAREISVRLSLGATRGRIVRQLLVESALLAAMAGVAAFALSTASLRLFVQIFSNGVVALPYWLTFPMDFRVFAFLAAISLGTAIFFGLVPAMHASRPDLVNGLNETGRGSAGSRRSRWTGALVVSQLALTLVLLAGAGGILGHLIKLTRTDAGVSTAGLVQASLDLRSPAYESSDARLLFYRDLDDRLAAVAGGRATLATAVPAGDAPEVGVLTDDRAAPEGRLRRNTSMVTVGRRYFQTLGIAVVKGREFDAGDAASDRRTVIVNERFVDVHLAGREPLGRRIRFGPEAEWLTIVGVVPNVRQNESDDAAFDPGVYAPFRGEAPSGVSILVRTSSGTGSLAEALRQQVKALDPNIALYDIRTVDEALARSRWFPRLFGSMFTIFAAIALVLAMVGLYAVTSYSVAQRTHEIGIRLAIGAQARHVWWTVTGRTAKQLAVGVAIGGVGGVLVNDALPGILVGTSGGDPLTLVAVAALLVLVGVGACFAPARRAMRLDPVAALRAE